MTTQRTTRALAREAAGLCLTAFGVLGVLVALGALHWAAGASAAAGGLFTAGILASLEPSAPRWAHTTRAAACIVGCSGLIGIAFALCVPVGWLCAALAVLATGLWLSTPEHENEGA
ncbi:hypothetical protein ABZ468_07985 [Streptomyces sp. NPDC005708]|uniref:hypothetical protein n=1 Tax=Streptomyces sp. NPDC005708 TaxID=3154564 RepID=UPI0033E90337